MPWSSTKIIQIIIQDIKSCIQSNCKTKKIKSKLEGELKLAILKKAAYLKEMISKNSRKLKGKIGL